MVERRKEGEPVAYITGRRAFWNIELHVGPGVLVPRPDSRSADRVRDRAFRRDDGPKRILDLGTGPGTLLLAALDMWPDASGLGVDVSRQRLVLCLRQRPAPGLRRPGEVPDGNWAEGPRSRDSISSCATRPMSPKMRSSGRACANMSPTRRCSPARGARCLSSARAATAPDARPGAGSPQSRSVTTRRKRYRAARPRRSHGAASQDLAGRDRARAANLGLNEIAWHVTSGTLHRCSGPGPLHHES